MSPWLGRPHPGARKEHTWRTQREEDSQVGRTGPSALQGPAARAHFLPKWAFPVATGHSGEGRGPGGRGRGPDPCFQGGCIWDLRSQWEVVCVSPVLVTPDTCCRTDLGLPVGVKMLEEMPWGPRVWSCPSVQRRGPWGPGGTSPSHPAGGTGAAEHQGPPQPGVGARMGTMPRPWPPGTRPRPLGCTEATAGTLPVSFSSGTSQSCGGGPRRCSDQCIAHTGTCAKHQTLEGTHVRFHKPVCCVFCPQTSVY